MLNRVLPIIIAIICFSCTTNVKKIDETISSFVSKEDEEKFKINEKITEKKEVPLVEKKKSKQQKRQDKNQKKNEPQITEKTIPIYPFKLGEKLTYNIYALGFKAGNMELEISNTYKSVLKRNVFEFLSLINTTGFVNGFFPLHYRVKSYTSIDTFDSLRYQLDGYEGKIEKHKIELYDYEKKLAKLYKKEIKENKVSEESVNSELLENSVDIIAAFYKIRFNQITNFKVINAGKNKIVKIKILERNIIKEFDNYNIAVDTYELSFDDEKLKDKIKLFIESKESKRIIQVLMPLKVGNVRIELN